MLHILNVGILMMFAMLVNNWTLADDTERVGIDENSMPDVATAEVSQEAWHFIA